MAGPEFTYEDLLPIGPDTTQYRKISSDGVSTFTAEGMEFLKVSPEAIANLTEVAIHDISHYLRSEHLQQLQNILKDPESSPNDRFVAIDLLKNANISAGGVLPMCQDTGTAIVMGKKGQRVLTSEKDEISVSKGVYNAYTKLNLRYSQMAPVTTWEEKNTGNNLPAQVEIYSDSEHANEYNFLFIAKGGGSANKSFLYQETKAVLNPKSFMNWLDEKLRSLGTSACPPYHLVIVIGGTSAEHTVKTAKLASTKYLDSLPTTGDAKTGHGFRDLELEEEVLKLTRTIGIGAQFGGKYFCHDVRVVRLPRHGASLPIAIAVSCSADRQAKAKITKEGVFIEKLETEPAHFLPAELDQDLSDHEVKIDLSKPMKEILAELSKHPAKTRVSLTGTLVVARDLAHAKIKELVDSGKPMPQYFKDYAVYYAGPAKTPTGYASGSFGPTTAGRMDSYVEQFQSLGASMIMLAKGNRSAAVSAACKKYGGFYLGSIGGPAARLAQDCIKKVEVLDYEELGMEAVWKIEVENFPAFIIIDDKGNDFYAETSKPLMIGKKPQ
ncbi:MAG: fumarate hydratase [Actinobacteria bacterium]|uniref:fumarate hydratase n=2 Tax=freshwater metagenome TaxID=449393 RepID=A0A6J6KZS7_9ZZZZ|nr:fumarate hydratase [Actinomycetota bacterium]MSZ53807.1 fumarate hydratase [Actinomycetota bacterium]